MTRRAVEAAYVRFVLDAAFERRLRADDAFAAAQGLAAGEREALRQIPAHALAVERRGRWRSLWARAQAQLPATAARLQAQRGEAGMAAWWEEYFAGAFWSFGQTFDVPPYGPGMEMASTVRLQLQGAAGGAPGPEAALLRDLVELEHAQFRARTLALGPSRGRSEFDLERAVQAPQLAARALAGPVFWDIDAAGAATFTRPGATPSSRPGATTSWRPDATTSSRPDATTSSRPDATTSSRPGATTSSRPDATRSTRPDATAFTLDPSLLACLASDRLDRYHTASTLYFTLGADEAAAINAAHAGLLAGRGDGGRWFVRDGAGWQLRPELYFRPTPSLLDAQTRLALVGRADGQRRGQLAVDRATLATLGELLPRLRPSRPREAQLAGLGAGARALLAQLVAAGLVVERPRVAAARPRDFGVTLIGHACLALDSPGTRVLVDPLLTVRNRPEVDASAVLDAGVDAVVISHCHWDHLNFDTLLQIDRAATVVVPRTRHATSITNLDIAGLCAELGFTRIVALDPWQSVTLGEIVLTALPYHGENNGAAGAHDWMTYHVALGGRSVCGLVDACRDAQGDTDAVMHAVCRALGPVDVLFAPCSDFHYPISNYTRRPFYASDALERYTGGPDDVARWTAIAGAGLVVPYALFHLLPGDIDGDADAVARDRYRRGGVAELRARLAAAPRGPLCALRPGDRLAWEPGGPVLWQPGAAPAEVRR